MNLDLYFDNENEKPLDNFIHSGGGLTSIFRTIGCVGDSLSSGEFESYSDEGITGWHDFYEYSWGQYIARAAGCKVYNFSRGGMTAKEFMESYGRICGAWDTKNICQAYIIALGVNDKNLHELGTKDNIGKGGDTFAGKYAEIICNLKRRQPKAKFFLMTIPKSDEVDEKAEKHAELIYALADRYENCYVIDLRKYGPVYDKKFKEQFYLAGHLNPAGYILTAQMVMSYIDYIIRHNPDDFRQVGFIGTPYHNVNYKW